MRVAFHLSSGDIDDWEHAIRSVRTLLDDGTGDVEDAVLVANGEAIWLFEASSPLSARVRALGETSVRCVGCQRSIRGNDIPEADLLANVEVVPSGVGALARLQAEGYAYLKVP